MKLTIQSKFHELQKAMDPLSDTKDEIQGLY